MKAKIITGALAILMLFSFVGCSSGNGDESKISSSTSSSNAESTSNTPSKAPNGTSEAELLALPENPASSYTYVESDENILITRHVGTEEIAVIPSKIEGKTVTEINKAFLNDNAAKAAVIPEGVVSIGESAFQACSQLETVVFKGDKVLEIGKNAFISCPKLSSVKLSDSITKLGDLAFSGCQSLKTVKFPANIKEIGISTFLNTGLESVVLSDGLEKIGAGAFVSCADLKTCTIPASVNKIDGGAFGSALTIITPVGSYAEQYAKDNGIKVENN
jgi:hypothetical protein